MLPALLLCLPPLPPRVAAPASQMPLRDPRKSVCVTATTPRSPTQEHTRPVATRGLQAPWPTPSLDTSALLGARQATGQSTQLSPPNQGGVSTQSAHIPGTPAPRRHESGEQALPLSRLCPAFSFVSLLGSEVGPLRV